MNRAIGIAIASLLFGAHGLAVADQPPEPPAAQLPKITVTDTADSDYLVSDASTATKSDMPIRDVPQSIEVRTRQLLDDLGGTQSSYEVAKTVAGLFDPNNGQGDPGRNVPNFNFRGYGNSGNYLKDGHMVNGWMSTLDMANIERVEFLKGPASVLYGGTTYAGNIGGIANYISKVPSASRVAALDLSGGSEGFYRLTGDFGQAANAANTVLFRLNGALEQADSFRDFAQHDSQFIAPALSLRLSADDSFMVLADAVHSHEVPGEGLPLSAESLHIDHSRNFIDPAFARTDITAQNATGRYEHAFGGGWRLTGDASWNHSRTSALGGDSLVYDPVNGSVMYGSDWSFKENQSALDLRLTGSVNSGALEHKLLLGLTGTIDRYWTQSLYGWNDPWIPVPGTTLDTLILPAAGTLAAAVAATPADPGTYSWNLDTNAVYFQDLLSVTSRIKLLVSARHDWIREHESTAGSFGASDTANDYSHTSPRVGIVFEPTQATSLYAVYSEAFTPQTGLTISGARVDPEQGVLREVGIKQTFGVRLAVDVSAYDLRRQNVTFPDPADPTGNAVLVAGETRSHGVELDVNGQLSDAFRVNVAATVMNAWISSGQPPSTLSGAQYDLVTGADIGGIPPRTLNVFGIYSFGPSRAWELGGGVYYASDTWGDNANTFRIPSLLEFEAVASWQVSAHLHLQFNAKNLTNRSNYTSNGWGTINPANPASFYGAIRYAF